VLGVRPDATHDEVRRAYTDRALRVHPDRLGEVSDSEREQAEWKMAELNLAWEVLRDPERRLAHDRDLARGGAPGGTRQAGRAAAAAAPDQPDLGVPPLEPEVEGAPTVVRRRRWGAHAPLIVVALLVVLVAVVGCLATITSGPAPEGVETTERFPVGSCVLVGADATVSEVACGEVGALLVIAREPFPRPCPSGSAAVLVREQDTSLCIKIGGAP
jgi:curved DNA-binding protein CbpA